MVIQGSQLKIEEGQDGPGIIDIGVDNFPAFVMGVLLPGKGELGKGWVFYYLLPMVIQDRAMAKERKVRTVKVSLVR